MSGDRVLSYSSNVYIVILGYVNLKQNPIKDQGNP